MKRLFIFSFYILFTSVISAQISTHWAKNYGSASFESGHRICPDENGNSYVGIVYIDTLQICNTFLPSAFQYTTGFKTNNYAISKLDSNGNCTWTKVLKHNIDWANGGSGLWVANMKYFNGDIYITGQATGDVKWDNDTLKGAICNFGCYMTFVIKIDANGNLVWWKSAATESYGGFEGLNLLPGGIILTGSYSGTLTLGTTTLSSVSPRAFMCKLDHSGNYLWAKNTDATDSTIATSTGMYDGRNAFYISGVFTGSVHTFPSGTYTSSSSAGNQTFGYYVAKYDTLGNYIWLKAGTGFLNGNLILPRLEYNSNGLFLSTESLGTFTLGTTVYTVPANFDYTHALIKLDTTTGQVMWTRVYGGGPSNNMFPSKNVYTTAGVIIYSTLHGTSVIGSTTLTSAGSSDHQLIYFSNAGNLLWTKRFGGAGQEIPNDIAYKNNRIYLTGSNGRSYNLDGFPMNVQIYPGDDDGVDVFIARMRIPSIPVTALQDHGVVEPLNVLVFPNPASSIVNLSSDETIDHVLVKDLLGKTVYESTPEDNTHAFYLPVQGAYLAVIRSGHKSAIRKIIIAFR